MNPGKLSISVAQAVEATGLSRTTIYGAISSGDLRSLKVGARRLIRIDALSSWLEQLEAASDASSQQRRA